MNAECDSASRNDDGLHGRRILIVENVYLLATELAEALAREGAEILGVCESIGAAKAILARARPDLAILDVRLGEENSTELAGELKELGVPMIVVTGVDPAALPRGFAGNPVLSKPADLEALAKLARGLVARRATAGF